MLNIEDLQNIDSFLKSPDSNNQQLGLSILESSRKDEKLLSSFFKDWIETYKWIESKSYPRRFLKELFEEIDTYRVIENILGLNSELFVVSRRLTGATKIPDLVLPNVDYFSANESDCFGDIPNFSNMPNLRVLNLGDNKLTGAIPNFSNLPNLEGLFLQSNKLTGAIPDFSNLRKLKTILLIENDLTGGVPKFDLPNLLRLDLSQNENLGNVGLLDFKGLPSLTTLSLDDCGLEGEMPDFTNNPNLWYLGLRSNNFVGQIPEFENNLNLAVIELGNNNFSGVLPDFENHKNIERLNLSYNNISGIKKKYEHLERLQVLSLDNNSFITDSDIDSLLEKLDLLIQ